jgi:hypothetical protein
MAGSLGESFARALAVKDFDQIASLLHPDVDFRGMTPGSFWQPENAKQAIDDASAPGSRTATTSTSCYASKLAGSGSANGSAICSP